MTIYTKGISGALRKQVYRVLQPIRVKALSLTQGSKTIKRINRALKRGYPALLFQHGLWTTTQ